MYLTILKIFQTNTNAVIIKTWYEITLNYVDLYTLLLSVMSFALVIIIATKYVYFVEVHFHTSLFSAKPSLSLDTESSE